MSGEERRNRILTTLKLSDSPVSGGKLAEMLKVSRQVIVQDIALLRAKGNVIIPTSHGYILQGDSTFQRVFKVHHTEERSAEELALIVDLGGRIENVFIFHKVYGVVKVDLNIRSRRDIDQYIGSIESGMSKPLMSVTSGYHYHTVTADSQQILDLIQEELWKNDFLAPLQEYEPVNFQEQATTTE